MTHKAFEDNIRNLITTIEYCIKNKQFLPGLILIYSGIDIMAWLDRPKSQMDVQKKDFIEWSEKYLLPGSDLLCNAVDLYSARCAIVHSYTSRSKLVRNGTAKEIIYVWGTGRAEDLQELIKLTGRPSIIAIHIDKLFESFQKAIKRFEQHLLKDHLKSSIVYERANKFFVNMPPLKIKKKT